MSTGTEAEAARFFQALGDATRLALLEELRSGEKNVGELVDALGCPQPKVSRHLRVLKDMGLVRDRREGRHVGYALSTSKAWPAGARRWLDALAPGLPLRERLEARPSREQPAVAPQPSAAPGSTPQGSSTSTARRPANLEAHLL